MFVVVIRFTFAISATAYENQDLTRFQETFTDCVCVFFCFFFFFCLGSVVRFMYQFFGGFFFCFLLYSHAWKLCTRITSGGNKRPNTYVENNDKLANTMTNVPPQNAISKTKKNKKITLEKKKLYAVNTKRSRNELFLRLFLSAGPHLLCSVMDLRVNLSPFYTVYACEF